MSNKAKTYDHFLKQLSEDEVEVINYLVDTIKEELPQAEMVMHWGMPVFRIRGEDIIALAVQKYYYSIYLWTMDWTKKYPKELKSLNLGKGCLRFKKLKQLPEPMLRDIIQQAGKRK
ncbi:MAG: DUF1801 domain-containing protein [Candidatus Stygibacter australis]|nr:DUF1801 domain-containing protein [Candidatus Stygibacter australis]MDP8323124.1 DUF1801 domain-containing protein [Candidatus Stygibacter australis]